MTFGGYASSDLQLDLAIVTCSPSIPLNGTLADVVLTAGPLEGSDEMWTTANT
jgi:hypothetical protein